MGRHPSRVPGFHRLAAHRAFEAAYLPSGGHGLGAVINRATLAESVMGFGHSALCARNSKQATACCQLGPPGVESCLKGVNVRPSTPRLGDRNWLAVRNSLGCHHLRHRPGLGAACPDLSHWADATGFVQRSRRQIVGEHPSVRRGGNSNACRRKSNSSSRSQGGAQSSLADLFQCESPVAGKTIDMLNALPARV
jgi:hypothetical protein